MNHLIVVPLLFTLRLHRKGLLNLLTVIFPIVILSLSLQSGVFSWIKLSDRLISYNLWYEFMTTFSVGPSRVFFSELGLWNKERGRMFKLQRGL